ncbi:MAG: hypothetical protein JEZ00_18710 [Anaerolineaceae bacterium]|nr:hypothetical protein [Anaerolineaceae bacterium]
MGKVFYTERDIEDMVKRGITSLLLTDDIVLTELAYESAKRLGLSLVKDNVVPPSAPVRPYISDSKIKPMISAAMPCESTQNCTSVNVDAPTVKDRVRNAVKARFGQKIDDQLLTAIIERVLNSVGV